MDQYSAEQWSEALEKMPPVEDVLNLKPGEWVEVKSKEKIRAALDSNNTYKGLRFMAGMNTAEDNIVYSSGLR